MINGFDFVDTTDTAKPDATPPEGVMHTDLERLRKGRVGAQFWSVYVPSNPDEAQAVQQTIEQIDVMKRLVARYPDDLMQIGRASCRERVCQYVSIQVVTVQLQKKNHKDQQE